MVLSPFDRVIPVIQSAGKMLVSLQRKRDELDIQTKSDCSIVTEADLTSNKIICDGIADLFPHDAIFSEETLPGSNQDFSGNVWIIDPLDGTKAFIDGRDDFSIQVALANSGKVIFSIMCYPRKDVMVLSYQGNGAFEFYSKKRLRVSNSSVLDQGAIFTDRCSAEIQQSLHPQSNIDSGWGFYLIVSGGLNGGIIRVQGSSYGEWDIAAASLAIEESGGILSNLQNERIEFGRNHPIINHSYIVASNGAAHAGLINAIVKY